ncbi:hypothetical protein HDV00_002617 [Rhizophlyctis rosea]|nr:hypothetical protein HDV00_002617 [Rhizophlyctis rosea]
MVIAPDGNVTFHRQIIHEEDIPVWKTLTDLPLRNVKVRADGMIEDEGRDIVQMDFANSFIGGGVLGHGAVQEEIRFIINPELLASRLFVEELDDNESLVMIGAQRFSNYRGYAKTFEWDGPHVDRIPRDRLGRIKTEIVGIDALNFPKQKKDDQFRRTALVREIDKAYCGFLPSPYTCHDVVPSIATGDESDVLILNIEFKHGSTY